MTDQTAGGGARAYGPAGRYTIAARSVYWIVGLIAALVAARIYVSEGGPATMVFTAAVNGAIAGVVLLLCRRPLVAAVVVGSLAFIITVAAATKRQIINIVLHAYDIVFYLKSSSTVSYLWEDYRFYVVSALAALLAMVVATLLAYRVDATRVKRGHALAGTMFCVVVATVAVHIAGERRHTHFEYSGQYLSSFYRSWSETLETLWRGQIIEAAPAPAQRLFTIPTDCAPQEKPPHVILIHHESIAPPSLFPQLKYDPSIDPLFRSDDGKNYLLRVETYGGASSLTEFSVLTGLSTYSFGGMRQFIHFVMAGKIKDTLPQALERCGYRNVLFYPMLKGFVSADKFFAGTGLNEIFDLRDQKARSTKERDGFYYKNALDEFERHIKASSRPMFAFIETMATHWPYHIPFMPEVKVPGGAPGTHPELYEYLRRLSMSKMDLAELKSELARRFPKERFLLVRYGDHQPMATRMLLGFKENTEAEDVLVDRNSIAFLTFFAINGVNFTPRAHQLPDIVDVPYIGTMLQVAAGLPLSDSYAARKRLLAACDGRYHGCEDQDRVLDFHRKLIDSALLKVD